MEEFNKDETASEKKPHTKKITVRDVAREAGVSVATVSYVMNDKKDAKISEATRKKVLQVANLLQYRPSRNATGLSTGRFHTIGIVYTLREDTPSRNAEILYLVNLLKERFNRMKYGILLLSAEQEISEPTPLFGLDGIIAIDLEEAVFKEMADHYYIPILCLDMRINDFLFYQIYTDMTRFPEEAGRRFGGDFIFLTEHFCNLAYEDYLCAAVPESRHRFVSELDEEQKLSLKDRNVLVYGELLGLALAQYTAPERLLVITHHAHSRSLSTGITTVYLDLEKKANLATNIMLNALEKKFDVKHEFRI